MSEQLDRLGRLIEAIDLAIEAARAETDPKQRERWLKAVERATAMAHKEYQEAVEEVQRRPALRVVKGGAVIAATTGAVAWLRPALRHYPHAGVAIVAVAMALTAVVAYVGLEREPGGGTSSSLAPITAAPPTAGGSMPSSSPVASGHPASSFPAAQELASRFVLPAAPSSHGSRRGPTAGAEPSPVDHPLVTMVPPPSAKGSALGSTYLPASPTPPVSPSGSPSPSSTPLAPVGGGLGTFCIVDSAVRVVPAEFGAQACR